MRAIGGGTALMLMMKTRLFQPTRLVSLRRLNGAMRRLATDEQGALRIGALTSLTELEHSKLVARDAPGDEPRPAHPVQCSRSQCGHHRRDTWRTAIRTWICRRILLTLGARVRAVSARRANAGSSWPICLSVTTRPRFLATS